MTVIEHLLENRIVCERLLKLEIIISIKEIYWVVPVEGHVVTLNIGKAKKVNFQICLQTTPYLTCVTTINILFKTKRFNSQISSQTIYKVGSN